MANVGTAVVLDCNPTCPSFDWTGGGSGDPLFAPSTLGVQGMAAQQASQLASAVQGIKSAFPPSHEVFLAYMGNPIFVFPGASRFAADSPWALLAAFRGAEPATVPGRGAAYQSSSPVELQLAGQNYVVTSNTWYSPLVLDLSGGGVLRASNGNWLPHPGKLSGPYASFDLDGDGFKDITEWIGPGNALLTTTLHPTSGRDLLGTAGGWQDGFQRLAYEFDRDGNGRVEGAELDGLYAWQDVNGNGSPDPGEVVSLRQLGIIYLKTKHDNYRSLDGYGYLNGQIFLSGSGTGTVWDWWPTYAQVNRVPHAPSGIAPTPTWVGQRAVRALRGFDFSARAALPEGPRGVREPFVVERNAFERAGIDLGTYWFALLGRGGQLAIGFDRTPGPPSRARLCALELGPRGELKDVRKVPLPFEDVFQMAADPMGRFVLVLGNQGSKLAIVDLASLRVLPEAGLDLKASRLRASGVAGHTGAFWFSAWYLGPDDAALEERVWEITPCGFRARLSLDALRKAYGELRQHFITGPDSGFFVVPAYGGESLIAVDGHVRRTIRSAESFGGLAAVPGGVAYTFRADNVYRAAVWWADGFSAAVARSEQPLFYPMLTTGRGAVVAAGLSVRDRTVSLTYFAFTAEEGDWSQALVLPGMTPGQGRSARGAFAHFDPHGLRVFPLPDKAPPPVHPVDLRGGYSDCYDP